MPLVPPDAQPNERSGLAEFLLVTALLLSLLILGVWSAKHALAAQAPPTSEGAPLPLAEIQRLRIENRYKDAQLAQVAVQQANQNFQRALADLTNEGERVKAENVGAACHDPDEKAGKCAQWSAAKETKDVAFDPNSARFTLIARPKPEPAKPADAETPKKQGGRR